jgi:hypothetical protein
MGGDVAEEGIGLGCLAPSQDRGVHRSADLDPDPVAGGMNLVGVGRADDHEVDVLGSGPGDAVRAGGERTVEQGNLDPCDPFQLVSEQRGRAGRHHQDLAERTDQWAVVVLSDKARATHGALDKDAGVEAPADLSVDGRVSKVGPLGESRDAQLVAGQEVLRAGGPDRPIGRSAPGVAPQFSCNGDCYPSY